MTCVAVPAAVCTGSRVQREIVSDDGPRGGRHQDLYKEEFKYASSDYQLSEYNINRIRTEDPEFFNRLQKAEDEAQIEQERQQKATQHWTEADRKTEEHNQRLDQLYLQSQNNPLPRPSPGM